MTRKEKLQLDERNYLEVSLVGGGVRVSVSSYDSSGSEQCVVLDFPHPKMGGDREAYFRARGLCSYLLDNSCSSVISEGGLSRNLGVRVRKGNLVGTLGRDDRSFYVKIGGEGVPAHGRIHDGDVLHLIKEKSGVRPYRVKLK